jgi:2-dehydro-3-deoxygalactonokinase
MERGKAEEQACGVIVLEGMASSMDWRHGFIAVDWGTTNRRAYRIGAGDACEDEFEDAKGILSVPEGGFPAAVSEIRERLGDKPLLLAGMIGSNRGWVEAPYISCPASLDDLVKNVARPGDREVIVPGVCYADDDRADVMRGEEVQLLGAVASGKIDPDALVCHPGTHNKWVVIRGGKIESFRTVMTGELFDVLKQHSILGDLMNGEVAPGEPFRRGVRDGFWKAALPAQLFSVRAGVILDRIDKREASAFISGLLIGADVRIGLATPAAAQVAVMGRPELTALYAAALNEAGRASTELDGEQCFLAGIAKIAEELS